MQIIILDDGYKNILYPESMAATERAMHGSESYLDGLAGKIRKNGVTVQTITRTGPVVKTILETSLKEDTNLIAMASHGRSGLARVFYGSVAVGIIQHIDRPLLVIRARDLK